MTIDSKNSCACLSDQIGQWFDECQRGLAIYRWARQGYFTDSSFSCIGLTAKDYNRLWFMHGVVAAAVIAVYQTIQHA